MKFKEIVPYETPITIQYSFKYTMDGWLINLSHAHTTIRYVYVKDGSWNDIIYIIRF